MASDIKSPVEENAGKSQTQADFALEGMTCASCAMRIEKGFKKIPGVLDAQVNLASERGTVIYDPVQTGIEQMVQEVEAVGYKAIPLQRLIQREREASVAGFSPAQASQKDEQSRRKQAEIVRKRNLLILGIVLSLPVVILSMFFMNRFPGENDLLLLLTTPVWAVVGWEFHRGAIKSLRHGSANMDTLVSVGSTAAYVLSVVATFFPQVVGGALISDGGQQFAAVAALWTIKGKHNVE